MSLYQIIQRALVILPLSLALTACNDIEGTLSVAEKLSLKNGKKTIEIPVGSYATEVEADGDEQVQVEVQVAEKKKVKIEFSVPKDSFKNKDFNIPASQTGQPYGLAGTRDESSTRSERKTDWESCSYDDYINECYTDRDGRTRCYQRRITRWGQRWVEFYDTTTVYTLAAQLVGQKNTAVAEFNGSKTVVTRDYINSGWCR